MEDHKKPHSLLLLLVILLLSPPLLLLVLPSPTATTVMHSAFTISTATAFT